MRTASSAAALVVAAALLATPLSAYAASPSPTPSAAADRTSLTISPAAGVDESTFAAAGDSDCHLMAVTLTYQTYAGEQRQVGKQDQKAAALGGGRYHYSARLAVPADARPQTAQVQAEPLCGSEADGFPPSAPRSFTVLRARPRISLFPRTVRPGETTRVRVRGCFGTPGPIDLTVILPGAPPRTVRATLAGSTATAYLLVPTDTRSGAATVSVGLDTCPGSASRTAGFSVAGATAATPSASPTRSSAASALATPDASAVSASPAASNTAVLHAPVASHAGRRTSWLAVSGLVTGLAVLALVSVAAIGVRRRRQRD
jgi:hypothetical protein